MVLFAEMINDFYSSTILGKSYILDVWQGSEYVSVMEVYIDIRISFLSTQQCLKKYYAGLRINDTSQTNFLGRCSVFNVVFGLHNSFLNHCQRPALLMHYNVECKKLDSVLVSVKRMEQSKVKQLRQGNLVIATKEYVFRIEIWLLHAITIIFL